MKQDNFTEQIKELTQTKTEKEISENREAIKHLATEIKKLKEKKRPEHTETSQTTQIENKIEKIQKTQKEIGTAIYTILKELEETPVETEIQETQQPEKQEGEEETEESVEKQEEETREPEIELKERQLNTLKKIGKNYKTAEQITEELEAPIGRRAVQIRLKPLKEKDLIETRRGKGIKLTEKGEKLLQKLTEEEIQVQKPEETLKCLICGKEYSDSRGFAGHLVATHGITGEETEEKISRKFNEKGKTRREINQIKEELGEVETPVDKEGDFPKFDTGEKIEDPNHWSMEERKILTEQILEEENQPISRHKIAKKLYNLEKEPSFGDPYYNRISSVLPEMEEENRIEKVEDSGTLKTLYKIPEKQEEAEGETIQEEAGEEKVSDSTHILQQKDGVDGRREFRTYKNTFTKLIHKEGEEEITYYDFSNVWGGDQNPMDAFRTIFESPTLLNGIRKEVCPDKKLSWSSRGEGKTPENWVLQVN